MYNSFAIWHEKKQAKTFNSESNFYPSKLLKNIGKQSKEKPEEALECELHFNLWQFSSQTKGFFSNLWQSSSQTKELIDYLDIGIKIKDITHFSYINFFTPFVVTQEDIKDLGNVITDRKLLLTAIFNECNSVETNNYNLVRISLLTENKNTEHFQVYTLNKLDDITLEKIIEENQYGQQETTGTLIKIDVTKINSNGLEPIYLRFRITFPSEKVLGKILHKYTPNDAWFKSSIEQEQFIDFRLNEIRNLPKKIQQNCLEKPFNINKVHFFMMREFKDELTMSDPDRSGYRVLEADTWSEYFTNNPKLDQMIAYHWKKKVPKENYIHNFTLSAKFSFQKTSDKNILIFIGVTLAIGAFGSWVGTLIGNLFGLLISLVANLVSMLSS